MPLGVYPRIYTWFPNGQLNVVVPIRRVAKMNCKNPDRVRGGLVTSPQKIGPAKYAWTDLTYLLHKNNISWGYYLDEGTQPDCANDAMFCPPQQQKVGVPQIWNPLPWFNTVRDDNQLGNIQPLDKFFRWQRTVICRRCPGWFPTEKTANIRLL